MKSIDIAGEKFGNMTAIERAPSLSGMTAWRLRCECGEVSIRQTIRLRQGRTPRCDACQRFRPLTNRFWEKVQRCESDECWEWQGSRHPHGHGQIGRGARKDGVAYAHVVSWTLHNGSIPKGLCVCHRCDNPPCVNPSHLFLGTSRENSLDMKAKDRHVRGSRAKNAKLNERDVIAIRSNYAEGTTQQALATQYGVSRSMIGSIVQRLKWVPVA